MLVFIPMHSLLILIVSSSECRIQSKAKNLQWDWLFIEVGVEGVLLKRLFVKKVGVGERLQ